MRADEVVEEKQHGNQVVGGSKGCKPLFRFVPGLELLRTEVKNGDKSGFVVRNELGGSICGPGYSSRYGGAV